MRRRARTRWVMVEGHRLPVPPPTPGRARLGAVAAMASNGMATCSFILWIAELPVHPAVAAVCNVTLALWSVGFALLVATSTGPRLLRHARRWHTEPLYRNRWEHTDD